MFNLDMPSFLAKALVFACILVCMLFMRRSKILYQKFFVWFYTSTLSWYKESTLPHKKVLFAPLRHFESLDKDLRDRSQFRILEIGIGPGGNFQFYPKNALIIAVDPNPYFESHINRAKFPETNVEKFIQAESEDLMEIEDGSVDVVVTTAVLCSVCDIEASLREIYRVLAPGGLYFFLEHVRWPDNEGWWKHSVQKLTSVIWSWVFGGCNITRDIERAILAASFDNVALKRLTLYGMPKLWTLLIGPHIMGTAQKKIT